MKKFHLKTCVAALVFLTIPTTQGFAKAGNVGHSIKISGHVAEICRVSFDASPTFSSEGVYDFGNMDEFCNAPQGYKITAQGNSSIAGAVMNISGIPVQFDETGYAVLVDSQSPDIQTRSLSLQTTNPLTSNISIRIQSH